MLILIGLYVLFTWGMGLSFTTGFVYALCSMLAAIFALSFPRKYISTPYYLVWGAQNQPTYSNNIRKDWSQ